MKGLYDRYVNGEGIGLTSYLCYSGLVPTPQAIASNFGTNPYLLSVDESDEFELANERLPTVHAILLLGSRATKETIPFSDVDIAVILDDTRGHSVAETRHDVQRLRGLCRRIYRIDPLMHHGLMFSNLSDFSEYDQMFLPVQTLTESKVLFGANRLNIGVVAEPPVERCRKRFLRNLNYLLEHRFTSRNAQDFTFKAYLAGTLLLPTLFLAAHGIFARKKDSFHMVYEQFHAIDWDAVKLAEILRMKWRSVPIDRRHAILIAAMSGKAKEYAGKFYTENYRQMSTELPALEEALGRLKTSVENRYQWK
jgi:hypothetical protein